MARSESHRANLSASLKAKWESGARKNGNTEAVKKKVGAGLKAAYADGRRQAPDLSGDRARAMSLIADPVKRAANARALGKAKKGVPNKAGPSGKGPLNIRSKVWRVMAPDGVSYEFVNLSEFVRNNSHLFDSIDTHWKGPSCRAVKRLSWCASKKSKASQWKGWVVVSVHSAPAPHAPMNQPAIEPAVREHTRLKPDDDGHVRASGTD